MRVVRRTRSVRGCITTQSVGTIEEELLKSRGVDVEVLHDETCVGLMKQFIADKPELWNEDIGE